MPSKRKEWLQIGSGKSYFHRTHQPLQCLIFITPLLLIYQIGAALCLTPNPQGPIHVVAFLLMLKFFSLFGAAGNYLPLLAVVAMLLSWHLARKDPWEFWPRVYAGMAAESLLLAIPIFVISIAIMSHFTHGTPSAAASLSEQGLSWQSAAVLSVGAGIYEELLFRLIAITLLNIILVDVFEIKVAKAIPIIILASALLFAGYHKLGKTELTLPYFFFLTAFGVYAAGIFIFRGFGIVVGCHAVYDLIVVMNDFRQHP